MPECEAHTGAWWLLVGASLGTASYAPRGHLETSPTVAPISLGSPSHYIGSHTNTLGGVVVVPPMAKEGYGRTGRPFPWSQLALAPTGVEVGTFRLAQVAATQKKFPPI